MVNYLMLYGICIDYFVDKKGTKTNKLFRKKTKSEWYLSKLFLGKKYKIAGNL